MTQKTAITVWIAALALLLLPLSQVQASNFYKWVDETGQVHYSQLPPPETESSRESLPRSVTAVKGEAAPEAAPEQAEEGPLDEFRRIRRENCEIARQNLEVYRTHTRIRRADGEVVDLNETEHASLIAETEAMINEFCDD